MYQFLQIPSWHQIHRQFYTGIRSTWQTGELKDRNAGEAVVGKLDFTQLCSQFGSVSEQCDPALGPNPFQPFDEGITAF